MKDFSVACFGDHAIRVAESGCTGGGNGSIINNAIQNSVACYYRTTLSSRKELIIKIIWTKRNGDVLGSLVIEDNQLINMSKPNRFNCQLLRKKKVSKSFTSCNSYITLHYDLSSVKHGLRPEPTKDFYLILIADSQFCLRLGDMCSEFCKKLENSIPKAKLCLFSRIEVVMNTTLYSTMVRFRDSGKDHEILIRCKGSELDPKDSELFITVNKIKLISVKRLQWNFRGNQTIFVEEGFAVDVMWDVHDWWFCNASHSAFFVFRTRSTLESRLWCDQELARNLSGFSLLIQFS